MRIVIVDDQLDSMRARIGAFLIATGDRLGFRPEVSFDDLRIALVPLFTNPQGTEDLRTEYERGPVDVWDDRSLYNDRQLFVERFAKQLQFRDLIIWDYRMREVPWIRNDYAQSIKVLSEIRQRRPTHVIVLTQAGVVDASALHEFQRRFSPDEFMAMGENWNEQALRDRVVEIHNRLTEFVQAWIGETGSEFLRLNIERKEADIRRRYVRWFIDEIAGVFESRGRLATAGLRASTQTYEAFWNLIVRPDTMRKRRTESLEDSRAVLARRVHAIRTWLAGQGEENLLRSLRNEGYELEPGIPVLIIADPALIESAKR